MLAPSSYSKCKILCKNKNPYIYSETALFGHICADILEFRKLFS